MPKQYETISLLTHPENGETRTLTEWAKHLGVSYTSLWCRYKINSNDVLYILHGEDREPTGSNKKSNKGVLKLTNPLTKEERTVRSWAALLQIDRQTIYQRYHENPSDHLFVLYGRRKADLLIKQHKLNQTVEKSTKIQRPLTYSPP